MGQLTSDLGLVLGLNLAVFPFSVGVYGSGVSCEKSGEHVAYFSESVVDCVEGLLGELSCSWDEIKRVVVIQGPGSYTGLRIAATVANTIATLRGVPVTGVSALVAQVVPYRHLNGVYLSATPGRKNEVNAAMFSVSNGEIKALSNDMVISKDKLGRMLEKMAETPTLVVNTSAVGADEAFDAPWIVSKIDMALVCDFLKSKSLYNSNPDELVFPTYSYPALE